jgi:hypothetical protein
MNIGFINKDEYAEKLRRLKVNGESWIVAALAIREIRDRKLYLFQYKTFDHFCREELGTGRANADRLCASAQIAETFPTDVIKPLSEAHVRPLHCLIDPFERMRV